MRNLVTMVTAVIGGLAAASCADLARDNPLDPKNPQSQRPRVVLVEAFVSDGTSDTYCSTALDALSQLEDDLGISQLVILEYHLQHPQGEWQDEYATQDANVRYAEFGALHQGVPDVFFNGAANRVQGAHSVETVYQRYRPQFERESNKTGLFTIEVNTSLGTDVVTAHATLARLGNSAVNHIGVRAVVMHDLGTARHRHVVRSVLRAQSIDVLDAGELANLSFEIPASLVSTADARLVLFVQDEAGTNKEVLQVVSVPL